MTERLRILVTGSREWRSHRVIGVVLDDIWRAGGKPHPRDVTLVSGACSRGADRMAEAYAEKFGWVVERHPADWERHGKRAGFLRNATMVSRGADLGLAFIRNDSKGATMTLQLAQKAGMPMMVWRVSTP